MKYLQTLRVFNMIHSRLVRAVHMDLFQICAAASIPTPKPDSYNHASHFKCIESISTLNYLKMDESIPASTH